MEGVVEGGGGRRLSIDGNLGSGAVGGPGVRQRAPAAAGSTAEHSRAQHLTGRADGLTEHNRPPRRADGGGERHLWVHGLADRPTDVCDGQDGQDGASAAARGGWWGHPSPGDNGGSFKVPVEVGGR